MRAGLAKAGIVALGVAAVIGLVIGPGGAAASGSGYNLSYTATTNSTIVAGVDLIAVSTTYSGGPNMTASLTLAGTPILSNDSVSYFWLFAGTSSGNTYAWAFVSHQSSVLHSSGLFLPEQITYTQTGDTLSISVNISLVGPASAFTFNGEASIGSSSNASTYSWLGTDFSGVANCGWTGCTPSGSGSGSTTGGTASPFPIGAIIWPVVIVVVVVIVILLVRRRRRAAASMTPPPQTPPFAGGPPPPPPPPAA